MASVVEMQLKVGAQLASGFGSTFNTAQKKLTETQREIQALGKVQGDISAYQKQEAAMAKCLKQQDLYKAQITNLKKELQALTKENGQHGAGTASLANKILDLEKKMSSAAAEEERHREALKSLGNELKAAGVNTKALSDEIDKVKGKIGDLKKQQEEAAKESEVSGNKMTDTIKAVNEALASAGILKALKESYDLMVDLTKGSASYADEIGTVSVQYSIATEDLQAFYYAAELVDVSQETLTSTMSRNIRAMNSAREGTESYVEAYEKLGIKVTDADGQLRDSETVYWEVIDALREIENETERDAVAIEILGRSAQQVNTLVAAGSGVIKQYAEEAKKAGYVMKDETLAACMALDDEIQRQNSNMTALKNTIGGHLAPEYTRLKQLENEALVALTAFTDEHPELIKGMTAGAGVIGVVVGGLAAYTAAAKLAAAATAAIPGVGPILAVTSAIAALVAIGVAASDASKEQNDTYAELTATSRKQAKELDNLKAEYAELVELDKENTYEAWRLEEQIKSLSEEYEISRQTVKAHKAEIQAAAEALGAAADEHENSIKAIDNEYESSIALIKKLEELGNASASVAQKQALIKPIIDELNTRYENLGLTFDYVSGKINLTREQLQALALEEANRKKREADEELFIKNTQYIEDKKKEYEDAIANLKAYEEKYKAAQKAREEYEIAGYNVTDGGENMMYVREITRLSKIENKVKKAWEDYKNLVTEDDPNIDGDGIILHYENAKKAIEDFCNTYLETSDSVIGETEAIIAQIEEMGNTYVETYQKAYAAAYESITGQFALWDNAAEVVPKSIADINNALATQASYWSDYNKDMSALLSRGQDIEGLAEIIASFADGSVDSVNAIAGMAAASDEDLRLMVENYNLMKAQQDEAAKTLARSTSEELLEIEDQMNSTIKNLDLKEEAALAGKSTIEAYVEALREGSEEAAEYLNALAGILGDKMSYNSAGTTFNYGIGEIYSKYATGTRNARSGLALVGEEGPEFIDFSGGETVYNAFETERMLRTMLDTYSLFSAVPAVPLQASSSRYEISISPTFYVTSEDNTTERLEEYSEIVADMVLDRLNGIKEDAKRGAFT